ncbi:MAG: methyl-accepting chemotaxis protein [Gemmatimonadaceae bacterium]|nr:methyl-accepting chemotaxis protein [Gemmatimonadaceae bacterium]
MQWFSNLKLRARLLVAFGGVLTLTTLLGGFAVYEMATMNGATERITTYWMPSVDAARDIRTAALEFRIAQFRFLADSSEAGEKIGVAQLEEARAALGAAMKEYEPTIVTTADSANYALFTQRLAVLEKHWDQLTFIRSSGQLDIAQARMVTESRPLFYAMDTALVAIVKFNNDGAAASTAEATSTFHAGRLTVIALIAVCIVLGVVISLSIASRISRTVTGVATLASEVQSKVLTGMRRALESMAQGDLTATVTAHVEPLRDTGRDELGDLSRSVDLMLGDMQATMAALQGTQSVVRDLVTETQTLATGAQAGALNDRADAMKYAGAFRDLVAGMNGTLDAVAAPVGEVQAVLARVAERDLSVRMTGDYQGAYAAIKSAVNSAVENLDQTLVQVNAAAEQVASAGGQITGAAQALASGASEQAASLQQVSASVHMFASMAQQSASNAGEARALAASAKSDTAEGTARMERLTQAVEEIRKSSADTARIVKTIDEIAFQTNLLALNAAVEAARAGDAGRGFAVVAEEVRSLALRAAEAAKNTATLIEQGQMSADRGVAINGEVMQSLHRINDRVEKVALVTAEISAATEQQVEGVSQIKQAVDQISGVTQQVASNAEESASAATELESQAQTLRDTVSEFTLTRAAGRDPVRESARPVVRPRPSQARPAPPIPRSGAGRRNPMPVSEPALSGSKAGRAADLIPFDDDDSSTLSAF